jgi:transcriptional regulator with XRE-family HTH domain
MKAPHIHGKRPSFSVSRAVDQLGEDISRIREEDGLTWADVGRVLGKSEDRAADYARGLSEMSFTSFLLGCREWNGRFSGSVMAMICQRATGLDAEPLPHRHLLSLLTRLAFEISVALEDDDEIDEAEMERMESLLDDVRRGLDALRQKRAGGNVARIGGAG